jgi:hypothetical protein
LSAYVLATRGASSIRQHCIVSCSDIGSRMARRAAATWGGGGGGGDGGRVRRDLCSTFLGNGWWRIAMEGFFPSDFALRGCWSYPKLIIEYAQQRLLVSATTRWGHPNVKSLECSRDQATASASPSMGA